MIEAKDKFDYPNLKSCTLSDVSFNIDSVIIVFEVIKYCEIDKFLVVLSLQQLVMTQCIVLIGQGRFKIMGWGGTSYNSYVPVHLFSFSKDLKRTAPICYASNFLSWDFNTISDFFRNPKQRQPD